MRSDNEPNSGGSVEVCSRCIYDTSIPDISFDDEGICSFCRQVETLADQYGTGTAKGEALLAELIQQMKQAGKGKKYDCVVGVSGGTDSSYLLIKCKEWGLRPLAVHYDNTWNSAIATENIRKVTGALGVDLHTYVIDNRESDDILRAFLLAGVPEFDASTDLAFAQVLRSAAAKFGIRYILEGHSFVEEGVTPMSKNYFDGKYIEDVHRKFGRLKMKTYPNLTFFQFMKWVLFYRQKFIRPLWYINYSKAEAKVMLKERTGWQDYGGHHLENRSSAFVHLVYQPQKFGMDNRNWTLSARARSGQLTREQALEMYHAPIGDADELVTYVKKRLGLSDAEYQAAMQGPKRSFRDFETYKRRFERLRPFFKLLADRNLVPRSFYLKYCFPLPTDRS
jgi:N-acetyl sugar amidotransferase